MTELKSREGYYLTQAADVADGRVFITAIKGVNVREEDWREATAEEKEEYEKMINQQNENE